MNEPSKKVLLVDDEPFLLDALSEYLERDTDRYAVLTAANGREALEILSDEEVALVVSDIYMPEVSGIHLLTEIKDKYPNIPVILMTAYHTPQIRSEAEKSGCLHFIEKPFELEQIRSLILERIDKREQGFVGTLKNIQLTDLIQMCCLSPITMAIRVTQREKEGTIYIQDGDIIHAECGDIAGEEAFYIILGWESGSFETLGSRSVPKITIEKAWQSLLMESARRIDDQLEKAIEEEHGHRDEDTAEEPDTKGGKTIQVLIVDDSAMMCKGLEKLLSQDGRITVIGTAKNGEEALEKISQLKPDLITLDVNMPVMDGGTALKHIMIRNPCPVIIISNLGSRSQSNILDFLRLGAIDFIMKPSRNQDTHKHRNRLIERVKLAANARIDQFTRVKTPKIDRSQKRLGDQDAACKRLVIFNSGPGGYAEVMRLIPLLPPMPDTAVIVFQTMAEELVCPLASYLDKRSIYPVQSLESHRTGGQSEKLIGGRIYVGSHDLPVELVENNEAPYLEISRASMVVSEKKGAQFDQFLRSAIDRFPGTITVAILSGAEMELLDGLSRIRHGGGRVIVQNPTTCTLPHASERVISAGYADAVVTPAQIGETLVSTQP